MAETDDENERLRAAALQNVQSIRAARQRAEEELLGTQRELRAAQERLQLVLDNLPLAVAWIGADSRYRFANPVFAQWVRHSLDEIVGRKVDEVLESKVVAMIGPHIDRVLAGEVVEYERTAQLPGLGERWIRIVFTPTYASADAGKRVDGWLAVGADVHESRMTSQRLREADRRKDEFLATLAHELRNPLAPIRSAVEIMRIAEYDPEVWGNARDIIERQVRQMVRLVDDLIDVSRITTGKLVLRRALADATAIARSALEGVAPAVKDREHHLVTRLPEGALYIDADATRLTQVFLNLLNNAVKFTDPGGRIEFEVGAEGADLVARVRDTGIGLSSEQLDSIFGMFTQGDITLERSSSGLGVGLALARRLVELHGGQVVARSAGLGQGSEFEVRLPRIVRPAARLDAPAPRAAKMSPRRILLVDDNRDFVQSLAGLLRGMGHELRVAHDGASGLEAALAFRPEVAFVDLGMPTLNGFDVARRLREQPGTEGCTLVALTGYSQPLDRERARDAGFDEYLVKPVEIERVRIILSGL
ncbi:MAG TPA: ATP-binding protein [Burkholderiales bacterium]|nr:ATP-binding protein [Burkholderiales bacterium]